ncbi:acid phosphatase AphA [Penicillium sp. IBT 16267x]|nr:acid phosphatase AphA [Penicillium sp. IBT 16267x]
MKTAAANAVVGTLMSLHVAAVPLVPRDVNEAYPYKGPAVPIGDWVDNTINGNGKGFLRITEPPAVKPASENPTNNVNVVQVSYVPEGINIHYQTPFGLGKNPAVYWGTHPRFLTNKAVGKSITYNRTPSCSEVKTVTMCNEFFHNVEITGLKPSSTYYYKIPAANGTTESQVLSFTTAQEAGAAKDFTVAVIMDMGYTNAQGTYKALTKDLDQFDFILHGGDLSYADDWYSGILPCVDDWPVCYNGISSELPNGGPLPELYKKPLPEGEIPDQGGPFGGDSSTIYETNWDTWQGWMNPITTRTPYMVLPGNHEAACAEFGGGKGMMAAYLNLDEKETHLPESEWDLTYYSCPPSQRNFTAFNHRFHMPGGRKPSDGSVGNMWYSFDYGLAHFISLNSETDFPNSPEQPFIADTKGKPVQPSPNETTSTDSGPFGRIDNNDYLNRTAYQQYQWLREDLASVDREVTPWVIISGHRPMYSSQVASYQEDIREAFEDLFLEFGVDIYLSGHIHWYERMTPMGKNSTIVYDSMMDNSTYYANPGVSMVHIVNGMAGNIESHSVLSPDPRLPLTQVLNEIDYGFSKMTITPEKLQWYFVKADGEGYGDEFTLLKKPHWTWPAPGKPMPGWSQPSKPEHHEDH